MLALLVEDDADLAQAIAELLEVDGYSPTPVSTVAAAREAMKARVYDVALVDWMLLEETSEELLPELAKAGVPTVFYSANDGARAVAERWNIAFVSKPFEVERLLLEVATTRTGKRTPRLAES